MLIKDIMTQNVECIAPTASIAEAAQRMKSFDVGAIPVCGANDKLVGMITDRDIAIRCVADGNDPQSTTVNDVMTPNITFCRADQDVSEASRLMELEQIRRLLVIDSENRLAGIVSLGDLAVRADEEEATSSETLEAISSPA